MEKIEVEFETFRAEPSAKAVTLYFETEDTKRWFIHNILLDNKGVVCVMWDDSLKVYTEVKERLSTDER